MHPNIHLKTLSMINGTVIEFPLKTEEEKTTKLLSLTEDRWSSRQYQLILVHSLLLLIGMKNRTIFRICGVVLRK